MRVKDIYKDEKISIDINYQTNITELVVKFIPKDIYPKYKIHHHGLSISLKVKDDTNIDNYDKEKRVSLVVKFPLSRSIRKRYMAGRPIVRPNTFTDEVIESDKVTTGIVMGIYGINSTWLFNRKINYEY